MVEAPVNGKSWPIKDVPIGELKLDPRNYRLDAPGNASQEYLREQLFKRWKVIEMAEGIVSYGGLYPSDNLIVTVENEKLVVLEGNRRLCAIQCLLDTALIPETFIKRFHAKVRNVDDNLRSRLGLITVAISPNRDDAEWLITARHTDYATVKWPLLTQNRRAYDAYSKLGTVSKAAGFLGISDSDAKNNIETYALFMHIRSLPFWTEEESDSISKNDLDSTAFTRNLFSEVIKFIDYKFDSQMRVISGSDQERTDYLLYKFARAAFIKGSHNKIDTRTTQENDLELLYSYDQEYSRTKLEKEREAKKESEEKTEKKSESEEKKTGEKSEERPVKGKRPVIYFSDLKCTVDNQRLKRLTRELSKITMSQFPAAATMLTRSLLEAALIYQIEKMKLTSEYHSYRGKDGLKKILNFSIHSKNRLFKDPKCANGLEYLENSKYKEFMDDIVHSKWIDPVADDLASIAGKIRELLKVILNDFA